MLAATERLVEFELSVSGVDFSLDGVMETCGLFGLGDRERAGW